MPHAAIVGVIAIVITHVEEAQSNLGAYGPVDAQIPGCICMWEPLSGWLSGPNPIARVSAILLADAERRG